MASSERASLSFVIDVVAGIPLDQDADMWTLTSDMSVRMRPLPAPERIDATSTILRQGRRSATSLVELRTDQGAPIATGAIGFVKTPRKATDPPKPNVSLGQTPSIFRDSATLTRPLREEADIQVIDAARGHRAGRGDPATPQPGGDAAGGDGGAAGRSCRRRPAHDPFRVVLRGHRPRPPVSPQSARWARCGPGAACWAPDPTHLSRSNSSIRPRMRSPPWSLPPRSPSPDRHLRSSCQTRLPKPWNHLGIVTGFRYHDPTHDGRAGNFRRLLPSWRRPWKSFPALRGRAPTSLPHVIDKS